MKIRLVEDTKFDLNSEGVKRVLREFLEKQIPKKDKAKKPTFPMDFILFKFPHVKKVLTELLTVTFRTYIKNIYVMAPKPTTLKVVLKNDQFFFVIYNERSYIVKVEGKKYYLLNLGEKERAIQAIADLLATKKFIVSRTEEGDLTGADKGDKKSSGGSSGGGSSGPTASSGSDEELPELPPDLTSGEDEIPGEEPGSEDTGEEKPESEDNEKLTENIKLRIKF